MYYLLFDWNNFGESLNIHLPGTDHRPIFQYTQKLWCEAIQKGELGEIRLIFFFFDILILQYNDSYSAAPGMCSLL